MLHDGALDGLHELRRQQQLGPAVERGRREPSVIQTTGSRQKLEPRSTMKLLFPGYRSRDMVLGATPPPFFATTIALVQVKGGEEESLYMTEAPREEDTESSGSGQIQLRSQGSIRLS